MTVTLSEKTSRFIEEKVRDGAYSSPEEIIEAALSMFEQQQLLGDFAPGELSALIAESEKDFENGDVYDGPAVIQELRELAALKRREQAK